MQLNGTKRFVNYSSQDVNFLADRSSGTGSSRVFVHKCEWEVETHDLSMADRLLERGTVSIHI